MMLNFLTRPLDYGWLARVSTSRAPILRGLLPAFSTLFTLLMISAALTSGAWLWGWLGATAMGLVPVFAKTFIATTAVALLNFWFNREITTAILNSRENQQGFKFDEHNLTNLKKLVNHVRCELNVHFRRVYGDKHVDLPMPRIHTYSYAPVFDAKAQSDTKLQATLGRNYDDIALFFPDTLFNSAKTRLNQQDIAALVAHQLAQAYMHRGWGATFSSIATSFLRTHEMLQDPSNPWYLRALGVLAGPFQYFFLIQKAIERSYSYEAVGILNEIGRLMFFWRAIDTNVSSSLRVQPAPGYLALDKAMKLQEKERRKPYREGAWGSIERKADGLELIEDLQKNYNRFSSLLNSMVRETLYYVQELNNSNPRTTRLKDYIRELRPIGKISGTLFKDGLMGESLSEEIGALTLGKYIERLGMAASQQAICSALSERLKRIKRPNLRLVLPEDCSDTLLSNLSLRHRKALTKILSEEEMRSFYHEDQAINQGLFNEIEEGARYAIVGPQGSGYGPALEGSPIARMQALEKRMEEERLQRRLLENRVEALEGLLQGHRDQPGNDDGHNTPPRTFSPGRHQGDDDVPPPPRQQITRSIRGGHGRNR